jgi:hypothetical protein
MTPSASHAQTHPSPGLGTLATLWLHFPLASDFFLVDTTSASTHASHRNSLKTCAPLSHDVSCETHEHVANRYVQTSLY